MLDTETAEIVLEGKAVRQKRIIPIPKYSDIDPFIRVDHFLIDAGGFPSQVHHGFEGLFYLFSGTIHHEDSLGNFFNIEEGGAELFSAGKGFLHSEIVEKKAHGIRIWINLPEHLKDMKPLYQRFKSEDIPVLENNCISVKTIVGQGSPIKPQTSTEILDITMCSQSVYKYDIPKGFQGFLYVFVGSIKINGKLINASETIYIKNRKDLAILSNTGARILISFGQPHGETFQLQESHAQ